MNLFQQILSVSTEFREHFEKENQQEERIKALESSGKSSNIDIFSCQVNVANESNIAIDKDEIINQFNMPNNIDLSQYKAVFYVVNDSWISFDSNLFSVSLSLGEDSIWKLNVVNQTYFSRTFTIFIVKKDSYYAYLFDSLDSIILREYQNIFYEIGNNTINSGECSWNEVKPNALIHPSSVRGCKYVSCTAYDSNDGISSQTVSQNVELKITTSYDKGYQQYKVGIQNNASTALTVNAVVSLKINMSR